MDTQFQDLVRQIEIDGANIRYLPIQNKLWFVVADICKFIGANLANIYNRIPLETKKVKMKKQEVRVTNYEGIERILCTSRSEKVVSILNYISTMVKKYKQNFKAKLIEKKYLFNKCYICGLSGLWQDKPLNLILFDNNDLFLLCPNCYCQTDNVIFIETCQECERSVPIGNKFCLKCQYPKSKPTKEKLKKDLIKHGMKGVEKKYGICKETIMMWMND